MKPFHRKRRPGRIKETGIKKVVGAAQVRLVFSTAGNPIPLLPGAE